MPVYVDDMRIPFRGMEMSHMVADSVDELLAMADRIGMRREWFQPRSHPHFDVSVPRRALAIAHGAIPVGRRELVAAIRRHRALWRDDPIEAAAIARAARATGRTATPAPAKGS